MALIFFLYISYDEPIKQVVETSNPTNTLLYVAFTGIALVAIAYVVIKKKQKEDDETSKIEESEKRKRK